MPEDAALQRDFRGMAQASAWPAGCDGARRTSARRPTRVRPNRDIPPIPANPRRFSAIYPGSITVSFCTILYREVLQLQHRAREFLVPIAPGLPGRTVRVRKLMFPEGAPR